MISMLNPYPETKDSGIEWLGEIPAHWEARRLKLLATINDEALGEDANPEYEITYVDIGNVDATRGILEKESYAFGDAPSRARRIVRDGDVIVSTVRTYLRAIAPILHPAPNQIVSTGFAVIRPRCGLGTGFASYMLRAPYFVERVVAESVGVSYPAINAWQLGTFSVAVPDVTEQQAIADFLDRETAKIDALAEKKERLIELLQEKRTALITHAVTKGLDPDVPMKDSGIEWLSQIPAHWEVKRNALLFDQRDERGYPDLPILNVSIAFGVQVREFSDEHIEQQASDPSTYKRASAGDIAFNKMRMWQGAVGVAPVDGLVSPDYTVAIPRHDVCARYYSMLFRTSLHMAKVYRESHGIVDDRNRLYWEGFRDIHEPVPPPQEQTRIAEHVDRQTAQIDALIAKVQEAIERLKEYRTALISAAVTGKIDVREQGTSEIMSDSKWCKEA